MAVAVGLIHCADHETVSEVGELRVDALTWADLGVVSKCSDPCTKFEWYCDPCGDGESWADGNCAVRLTLWCGGIPRH